MTNNNLEYLFAWVTRTPDGSVCQVGAMIGKRHMTLSSRDHAVALELESLARQHAERTGQPVWLRVFKIDHDDPELSVGRQ